MDKFKSLDEMAKAIDQLKGDILFDSVDCVDQFKGSTLRTNATEQHFLSAIAHLDLAYRAIQLAVLANTL